VEEEYFYNCRFEYLGSYSTLKLKTQIVESATSLTRCHILQCWE